jgi:hypothetical protein
MEIFHDAHPFSQLEDELLVEGGGSVMDISAVGG